MKIKVIIADDHKMVLDGLISVLEDAENIEVTGTATNGELLLKALENNLPDVVILDIEMPGMDGIRTAERIREQYPGLRILVLSMHDDRSKVEAVLKAGVKGYLLKNHGGKELVNAIEQIHAGQPYYSEEIRSKVMEWFQGGVLPKATEESAEFTHRELEVLRLAAEGLPSTEIADKLHIAISTVNTHRKNMMAKLKMNSILQVAHYARTKGLI